jgi:polyhydroxyalkanoate synthase
VNVNMAETSPEGAPRYDPAELAQLYAEIARKSAEAIARFARHGIDSVRPWEDELGLAEAFFRAWARLLADPLRLAQTQARLWQDYAALWQRSMLRLLGQETEPVVEPEPGDRRFRHEDWQRSFLFDFLKQSYLIAARRLHEALAGIEGLDERTARKVEFYTRRYIEALSPSNFLLTNPEALRETLASGGQNLLRGLDHLLEDLARSGPGGLRVKMTDERAFELGRNVATAPGKVVYQNELAQLIQYEPATAEVHRRPLLIVPPWINKYYILDLREDNSFVRWAVRQGHTVFVISWVNPDERLAHKSFDDYLVEGPLAALEAIERATGSREANAIGYCLGGTLLACLLAYLAARGERRVASATFFASLIDFSDPGELGVFVDEKQVASLERRMRRRGYLEGSEMAATFNLLRANDLIWSFVVERYLLGREPVPFDLLYWNSDSTRMPARMHAFYLRNMYLRNLLREPGGISLAGVPIDLARVEEPLYFVATAQDHIAPWRSVYAGARLFRSPVRFVLGESGHIAGIVNPPAAGKYGYWTNEELPADPEQWLRGARRHAGSWWPDWARWVAQHGGGSVPARVPGAGGLEVLEDAPGSYVRMRADGH